MAAEPVLIRDADVFVPEDAAAALRAALAGAPGLAAVAAAVESEDGEAIAGWWCCEDRLLGGALVWEPAPAAAAIPPDVPAASCFLTDPANTEALRPGRASAWLHRVAAAGRVRTVADAVVRADRPPAPPSEAPIATPTMLRTPDGILRPHPASFTVSVVTVTFNGGEVVRPCVESVLETIGPKDRMVVVDNASDDTVTREVLAGFDDPRLVVLLQDDNVGFSRGCNVGIEAVESDAVVLLNPDTEVYAGWLDPLLAAVVDRRVGAAGPLSDYVAGIQQWRLHSHLPAGTEPAEIARSVRNANGAGVLETKLLIGLCMLIPRRLIDELGGLDEDLFLGNDDLEYSWRLRRRGYALVVAAGSFVHHDGHVSFDLLPEQEQNRFVRDSTDALARKLVDHYGWGSVPSPAELWDMDWFRPSMDIWGPKPRTFVIAPEGSRLDAVAGPLRSFLGAFDPTDPCRLVIAVDPAALPFLDDCVDVVVAELGAAGLDPGSCPEITVDHLGEGFDPAPFGDVLWFAGDGLVPPGDAATVASCEPAARLRNAAGLQAQSPHPA